VERWETLLTSIQQDDDFSAFKKALHALVGDLLKEDKEGNVTLNYDAIGQIRALAIPIISEELKYIPLPSVEGCDDTYDYRIENMVLSGSGIIPEKIRMEYSSHTDIVLKSSDPTATSGVFTLTLEGIKTEIKDLHFCFQRRVFPKWQDDGLATVDIEGDGLVVQIRMNMRGTGADLLFSDAVVFIHCDELRIKIHESKHDFMYSFFSGTVANAVKPRLERKVGEAVANVITRLRRKMNELLHSMSPEKFSKSLLEGMEQISKITQ